MRRMTLQRKVPAQFTCYEPAHHFTSSERVYFIIISIDAHLFLKN